MFFYLFYIYIVNIHPGVGSTNFLIKIFKKNKTGYKKKINLARNIVITLNNV